MKLRIKGVSILVSLRVKQTSTLEGERESLRSLDHSVYIEMYVSISSFFNWTSDRVESDDLRVTLAELSIEFIPSRHGNLRTTYSDPTDTPSTV